SLTLFDDFFDGLARVDLRLLFEQADAVAFGPGDLTSEVLIDARDDLEQAAFSRPVQAEHPDLGSIIEAERDLSEHLLFGWIDFADVDERENDLLIVRGHGR